MMEVVAVEVRNETRCVWSGRGTNRRRYATIEVRTTTTIEVWTWLLRLRCAGRTVGPRCEPKV